MKPANALKHYFNTKDSTSLKLKRGVVYQINCEDYRQYFGETGRSFSTKCREHMLDVDSWKPNRNKLPTHAISNDHKIYWLNT